jgi:hypothetical protein
MERRGLAFQVEYDFYKTEQGQIEYMCHIQQIVNAIVETNCLDVALELLQVPQTESAQPMTKSLHSIYVDRIHRHNDDFAIIQKGPHGLGILVANMKKQLTDRGADAPDTLILPQGCGRFIHLSENKRGYFNSGHGDNITPSNHVSDGPPVVSGVSVYESRPFMLSGDGDGGFDPFFQQVATGSFNVMSAKNVSGPGGCRDIIVYDEDRDTRVVITYEEALRCSNHGAPRAAPDGGGGGGGGSHKNGHRGAADENARQRNISAFKQAYSDILNMFEENAKQHDESVYQTIMTDIDALNVGIRNANLRLTRDINVNEGVLNPYQLDFSDPGDSGESIARTDMQPMPEVPAMIGHPNILLIRFPVYVSGSAVMFKSGKVTGSTHIGHREASGENDAVRKMFFVHFTLYSKAVVQKNRNVVVQHHVYVNGYEGGNGSLLYDPSERRDVENSHAHQRCEKSIYCIDIGNHDITTQAIDLTGNERFKMHDDVFRAIDAAAGFWGWDLKGCEASSRCTSVDERTVPYVAPIAWQSFQQDSLNPQKETTRVTRNKGCFGRDAYGQGFAAAIRGKDNYVTTMSDSECNTWIRP